MTFGKFYVYIVSEFTFHNRTKRQQQQIGRNFLKEKKSTYIHSVTKEKKFIQEPSTYFRKLLEIFSKFPSDSSKFPSVGRVLQMKLRFYLLIFSIFSSTPFTLYKRTEWERAGEGAKHPRETLALQDIFFIHLKICNKTTYDKRITIQGRSKKFVEEFFECRKWQH